MVDCSLCFLSYFFTHSVLLWICLHDVAASSCERTVYKSVGDTVELSSCLPTEGVNSASWKYKNIIVAGIDEGLNENSQFGGRIYLNPTNYSLILRNLTPRDSGDFSFISEANDKQRKTININLQVKEIITNEPTLTVYPTWHASNESCTFELNCSTNSYRNVSFNWIVGNQTFSGSRQQVITRPKEGNIKFTCTIFNSFSNKSASKTVKCSNNTSADPENNESRLVLYVSVSAGGCLMIVIIISIIVCVSSKRRRTGKLLIVIYIYIYIYHNVNTFLQYIYSLTDD
ncbi:hypothetical protein PAMA_013761 [Pampus argenteus]